MTVASVDDLIAGFKPPKFVHKILPGMSGVSKASFWAAAGIPGPGSYDSTLNGVVLSSTSAQVNGQVPFVDPAGGQVTKLARLANTANNMGSGLMLLCDRLWHNGGFTITSTGAQSITSPTWPARDENGQTNGVGVLLGVEVSAAVGAATPAITIGYTNSAGTSGRSASNIDDTLSGAPAGSFFPIGLQSGDDGVRSVQSLTLNASWISGTINLVAYRVIAAIDLNQLYWSSQKDAIGLNLPPLYNGSVPFFMQCTGLTSPSIFSASLVFAQG